MEASKKNKFFIITGISGAGKTQALKIFGDFGYYCVDNLPLALFRDFIKYIKTKPEIKNIALGIDIREGENIKLLPKILQEETLKEMNVKLIFLDASNKVLLRRFSETKHRHPLPSQLLNAIEEERDFLKPVQKIADVHIDTSYLTLGELKEKISQSLEITSTKEMNISVVSFGYKNGIPLEADLVIDVRFLVNPYYEPSLRNKTGLDKEVQDYIEKSPEALEFLNKMTNMISYLVPKYIKEGKSYLTIAIGCTGGKHRSVFMAHKLARHLAEKKFKVSQFHRDIQIVKKEIW